MEELIKAASATGVFSLLFYVEVLILADTTLGVLVALKHGAFDLNNFPDFLMTSVLPYMGGLAIMGGLALVPGHDELKAAFYAAAVPVVAMFVKSIIEKIGDIVGIRTLPKFETEQYG